MDKNNHIINIIFIISVVLLLAILFYGVFRLSKINKKNNILPAISNGLPSGIPKPLLGR